MANVWYPKFKEALLKNLVGVDLQSSGTNVGMLLVDTADYTYSASHEFLSDVPSIARVSNYQWVSNKLCTDGAFWFDNFWWESVIGDSVEAIIAYIGTGVEATSRLMIYRDTGVTRLPCGPTGGDIVLAIDSVANGGFARL